tara:strand:- start:2931 stop:3044 length:114 start_codon:yes stop_codon:yes gene_type:complete
MVTGILIIIGFGACCFFGIIWLMKKANKDAENGGFHK